MPELAPADVRALAASLGLALEGEDLVEVTHRLNAFLGALRPLGDLPLETVAPLALPHPPGDAA